MHEPEQILECRLPVVRIGRVALGRPEPEMFLVHCNRAIDSRDVPFLLKLFALDRDA